MTDIIDPSSIEARVHTARDIGMVPRVHPNGFLQLDLDEGKLHRLHVWADELPRQERPTPIHDHEFDFVSGVFLGRLLNRRYEVLPTDLREGDDLYVPHFVERDPNSENTLLVPEDVIVTAHFRGTDMIHPGRHYEMDGQEYHWSDHEGLSLSIMSKMGQIVGHRATVLVPLGTDPDNEFSRESHSDAELWELAFDAAVMADEQMAA